MALGLPGNDRLVRIRSIAERIAQDYGLDIFDVQLRRGSVGLVLRIVIDRPARQSGPGTALPSEDSVSIEDCQRVSHDVGTILDVEDVLDHAYTLEVSSPGLDRPLRGVDDFRRFQGRLAKIVVSEAVDGQKHFEGRITGVEGDAVLLEQGRRLHRIPVPAIARAHLEVEF